MTIRFTAIFALLFALSTAAAQAAPPAPTPRPKPDFTPFAFLVGNWSCAAQESDRAGLAPSTTTWKMDPKGYWLRGNTVHPAGKWSPYAEQAEERMTYDADAGLWIYEDWRDMGGYNLYTTRGFTGSTAVWTDHSFFRTKETRAISTYTLKKMGEAKYLGTFSETDANGTVVSFKDICTKS